jgi:hypothetical protein
MTLICEFLSDILNCIEMRCSRMGRFNLRIQALSG